MNTKPTRRMIIILIACTISLALYLAASARLLKIGFPLDDAWIHQTYARSLAETGVWTFQPGKLSAGSTSPLWTAILSLGYFLNLPALFFSTIAGLACLAGCGLLIDKTLARAGCSSALPWAGLLAAMEWHLAWAALSGMETLLFGLLVLLVLTPLMQPGRITPWLGALAGLAVWVRPEGVTLLAPLLLSLAWENQLLSARARQGLQTLAAFGLVVVPYLWMNLAISGSWWPNTYYAKQIEYASLLRQPLLARLVQMVLPFLTGAGTLLLPGFIVFVIKAFTRRQAGRIWSSAWLFGIICLYALRMPVTYQHGRYLMPAICVYVLAGLLGTLEIVITLKKTPAQRVIRGTLIGSIVAATLGFWILGANAYARDTAIIETEMVAASEWIRENTAPGQIIAAHDIGALGYFGQRDILDLAGLIDPQIIPIMRNEAAIKIFLDKANASYLMTFPGWYPDIVGNMDSVYCTSGQYSIDAGGENMCVYQWSGRAAD